MNQIFRKVLTFSAVLLCILLVIFGFTFASPWTGIIFVLLLCAISLPLELFASAIPRALFELKKLPAETAKAVFVILDTAATVGALALLDYFMHDVEILPVSAFIIALVLALFSLNDFTEKLEKEKEDIMPR